MATAVPGTMVHAFEPGGANVVRLRANAKLNRVTERITIVEEAVSNENGQLELFEKPTGMLDPGLDERNPEPGETVHEVPSTTLDAYCDRVGTVPDLIKVDVEGAGGAVLEGASDVLEGQPDWILEVHTEKEEAAFRTTLKDNGYTLTTLAERSQGIPMHVLATAE